MRISILFSDDKKIQEKSKPINRVKHAKKIIENINSSQDQERRKSQRKSQ